RVPIGQDRVSDSFHEYGLALDLNAPENPQTSGPHPFGGRDVLPANTGTIARPFGIEWGGLWSPSTPEDYMHVEQHLDPAGVAALAATLGKPAPAPAPTPTPTPAPAGVTWGPWATVALGSRVLRLGTRG